MRVNFNPTIKYNQVSHFNAELLPSVECSPVNASAQKIYSRSLGQNVYGQYNNFKGFQKFKKENSEPKNNIESEIKTAKTKKAISECAVVCLALGILYFGMKHNFKVNRIKAEGRRLRELENLKLPEDIGKKIKENNFLDNFLGI